VRQDVEDVACLGIDDGQTMNLVLDKRLDGLEQARVRIDVDEIFDIA
jgi:hypothetical protein